MSGESLNRPDFCLFSHPNEQPWKDYFLEMLENKDLKLSVKCEDVTSEKHAPAECADCVSVIILLSPSMLITMTDAASNMVTILQDHPCVAVIRMMTSSEEFEQKIKTRYAFTRSWHEFDVSVADQDDNRRMIASIIDLFDKERTPKKPIVKPRPRKKNIPKSVGMVEMVCPDSVRKADERVVVVFREAVTGTVQIGLKDSTVRIDTKKLNPCCYRFNAPDHKAGKTKVIVYIDGKKSGHSWPFRYEAPTIAAYQTPAFLCQVLGLDPADTKGLDEHLTTIYKESLPGDECLKHMLTSQIIHNRAAGVACDCQLPTLLHFAAYYGLQDLCASILETPGAEGAFEVTNIKQQNPYELAAEQGHEDIADYMDSFMEMQCYVQDYEAMYKYINTPEGAGPGAVHDYLSMSARDYVPHVEYTPGGFPSHEEDGYVLANRQQALVSEVRPEDDVRVPEIPARAPAQQIAPRARQPTRPTPPSSLPHPAQVASAHNTTPLRSGDRQETPDDVFSDPPPISPLAMGSRTGDELCQMQEAYRQGEFTIDEVQRLFRSWQSRNPDSSLSMKERQKKLQEIKAKHGTLIQSAEKHRTADQKKKSGSFLSRLTRKKTNEPTPRGIEIEHCVGNQYTTAPTFKSDRLSTISNTSTISSSSSSSRDSALGPIEEYTDSEPEECAPPVPRRESSKRGSQENRQSLGDVFLASVPHRPASRLPQPPPTRVAAGKLTLPPKLPPRKFSS